jgi:5'-methylthioadenosine phosphorylase
MPKIGIIGGTGTEKLGEKLKLKLKRIKTRFGTVSAWQDEKAVYIDRHGDNYCAPHAINYRANLLALEKLGVSQVIAIAAVGSMNSRMRPGDLVLLSDFIDFTRGRIEYIDPAVFTDVSSPYDKKLMKVLLAAGGKIGSKIHPGAVYACAEGPRFESKAEIRMYRRLGADVVGMTQVPEVILAAERKIPYAVIAVVTNYAAGISKRPISSEEVSSVMGKKLSLLGSILKEAVRSVPAR